MDAKLLDMVACPICNGRLTWQKEQQKLICLQDQIAYPIKQGIPVLLADQAAPYQSEKE